MLRNERGISIIEILVTVVLVSIIGTIIWSVFFQGYKFSHKAISKTVMQQEVNIVVSNLTRVHQTSDHYQINKFGDGIKVVYTKNGANHTNELTHPKLKILITTDPSGIVIPQNNDVTLSISIIDKNDPGNRIDVATLLYRLKGVGNE